MDEVRTWSAPSDTSEAAADDISPENVPVDASKATSETSSACPPSLEPAGVTESVCTITSTKGAQSEHSMRFMSLLVIHTLGVCFWWVG